MGEPWKISGDLNFNGFPGKLIGICWDIIGICNGRVVTAWTDNYFTTSSGINAIHGNTLSADQQKITCMVMVSKNSHGSWSWPLASYSHPALWMNQPSHDTEIICMQKMGIHVTWHPNEFLTCSSPCIDIWWLVSSRLINVRMVYCPSLICTWSPAYQAYRLMVYPACHS